MRWLVVLVLIFWSVRGYASSHFVVPSIAERYKRIYIAAWRTHWGLNYPAALGAQIGQESGWREGLTSSAKARGQCQAIEPTAIALNKQVPGLSSLPMYGPHWCAVAQAALMKELYGRFRMAGRGECDQLKFALSAYNGGLVMLSREIAECVRDGVDNCDPTQWSEHVEYKRSRAGWAFVENRTYVRRIIARESTYATAGWGREWCSK
jgi:hypothetical protein